MEPCVFCEIVAGKKPSHRVYEDEHCLAFLDIGHVNPGHVLVALKTHAETLFDISDQQAAAAFQAAAVVARRLRATFAPDGLTVLQANGAAGWQTVRHFHLHVLPRHPEDGVKLTWPVKNPTQDVLAGIAARISAARS